MTKRYPSPLDNLLEELFNSLSEAKKASLQKEEEKLQKILQDIELMQKLMGEINLFKKPKFTEKEMKKLKKTKLYPLVKDEL